MIFFSFNHRVLEKKSLQLFSNYKGEEYISSFMVLHFHDTVVIYYKLTLHPTVSIGS